MAGLRQPASSVRKALEASIKTMSLPDALAEVDTMGQSFLASEVLLEECAQPSSAEYVVRVARWRFGQRSEPRHLDEIYRRAPAGARGVPTLSDMEWRLELLDGKQVSPGLTGAAVHREPLNVDFLITHALALLRDGRSAEARQAFAQLEPLNHHLFAAQKAVLGATGSQGEAVSVATSINLQQLPGPEYRLVYRLVQVGAD